MSARSARRDDPSACFSIAVIIVSLLCQMAARTCFFASSEQNLATEPWLARRGRTFAVRNAQPLSSHVRWSPNSGFSHVSIWFLVLSGMSSHGSMVLAFRTPRLPLFPCRGGPHAAGEALLRHPRNVLLASSQRLCRENNYLHILFVTFRAPPPCHKGGGLGVRGVGMWESLAGFLRLACTWLLCARARACLRACVRACVRALACVRAVCV